MTSLPKALALSSIWLGVGLTGLGSGGGYAVGVALVALLATALVLADA